MPYPRKVDRNKDIIEMRDKLGWTFAKIADYCGFKTKAGAINIYQREKKRENTALNKA